MTGSETNFKNYLSKEKDKGDDEKIIQPFMHINRIFGKKFRTKFCAALNIWLQISKTELKKIEYIIETFHNASLLLDDIQDYSVLRRGVPTAHSVFGIHRTVISANYVGFVVLERALEMENSKVIEIITRKCADMYKGQGMEIYWRDNLICPSLEEYKLMCIRKTGGLFLMGIELMQVYSEVKIDLKKFGEELALYFQIRDDYMNLCSNEYSTNKSFCDDISEGKFSFPIIHAIQTHPEDKRVIDILKQRPRDYETKSRCLILLKKFGSIDYTKKVLTAMKEQLEKQLQEMPENVLLHMLLDKILYFD